MVVNSKGYCFEGRKDCNGDIGVKFYFNVTHKNGYQYANFVCTVDSDGKTTIPAYIDSNNGFRPLSVLCNTEGDLENFVVSNKPVFGKLGEFLVVVAGTLVYDDVTGSLVSSDDINFYMPVDLVSGIEEFGGNIGVACHRLSLSRGLNTRLTGELMLESYRSNIVSTLGVESTTSRLSFIKSLGNNMK